MILGKHINRYYLRYAGWLILGLLSLIMVDYLQLEIPKLYGMVVNGMNMGYVELDGVRYDFTVAFLLDHICMPMVKIILAMVFGRFLWRICFFGSAVKLEEDLRNRMFSHAKDLSREYYQVNKVGDLMSLFTNDLDTVQECFGWGVMMLFDALLGHSGHHQYVEHGSAADGSVFGTHGLSAGFCHGGGPEPHAQVGCPSGGVFQTVGLFSGKLLRYRGDQGLREGRKGAVGL